MKTKHFNQLLATSKNHLVEYAICILTIIHTNLVDADILNVAYAYVFFAPFFFVLSHILNYYTQNKSNRWIYYASGLVFAATFAWKPEISDTMYLVATGISVLALWIFKIPKDNKAFAQNTLEVASSAALAIVISAATYLLINLLHSSICYLFDIKYYGNFHTIVSSILGLGLAPILFLNFQQNPLSIQLDHKFFSRLFIYLLVPALLMYMLVLYAYFLKIGIQWELPKGGVAMMVMAFGMIAFALKLMYPLFETNKYTWLFKYFPLYLLPALVMFWIGTIYRIYEFGFTEARVYLCIGGITLSLATLMLLSQKTGRYLYFAWILIGLLFTLTFIPKISAKDIETYSQQARGEDNHTAVEESPLQMIEEQA